MATRAASGKVLNAIAQRLPELVGGSADLAPSTNTLIAQGGDCQATNWGGRNLHFGVREHGMGAILNGMALHGGLIPYGATFLIFSDYMRPPIRLAAMMGLKVIYVFTHDSIGLGEDGPTHQPIEQLAGLRAVPNLVVIRPADPGETAEAWRVAIWHRGGPVALVLTRQKVPALDRSALAPASGLAQGGYVLAEAAADAPRAILLASGSEVAIALEARTRLEARGVPTRVVSLPSLELFRAQPADYRERVLPPAVRCRVAIEAAHPQPWYPLVGDRGAVIGLTRFGASAPYQRLYQELGLTPDAVVERVQALLVEGA
jgi:transketolase